MLLLCEASTSVYVLLKTSCFNLKNPRKVHTEADTSVSIVIGGLYSRSVRPMTDLQVAAELLYVLRSAVCRHVA